MKKIGINSNMMKIIAIIAIIFDHIGVYFEDLLSVKIYITFRTIGRIAMPIFAYLIVQGYFYTKDLSKYLKRLFITGVITQIILFICYTINNIFVPEYIVTSQVLSINIIISFAISLIVLKAIDETCECVVKKKKLYKNLIFLDIVSIIMVLSYFFVEFDYSYNLIIYIILMYIAEKLYRLKKIDKAVYYLLELISMLIFVFIYKDIIEFFAIFSLIFIYMYNFEKGKSSKCVTAIFYAMYPLQHLVLYILAMIICLR